MALVKFPKPHLMMIATMSQGVEGSLEHIQGQNRTLAQWLETKRYSEEKILEEGF